MGCSKSSAMAEGQAVTYKITKRLEDMEPIGRLADMLNTAIPD